MWSDFARGDKKRSLRVMSTDATRKLNAHLKTTPKLKGQSEKISKEYGQSLDAAFPVDTTNDDNRMEALRRGANSSD